MPRQSLGSPSSKLQIHGGSGPFYQEEKLAAPTSPPPESPAAAAFSSESRFKTEKTIRSNSKASRYVHLIPLLTFLCLLILYLFSHDPSPKGIDGMEKAGAGIGSRRTLKMMAGRRRMGNA